MKHDRNTTTRRRCEKQKPCREIFLACTMNLLAISTLFMTQTIFLEISQSFSIDLASARFSFSMVSLLYAASFLFLGPLADAFHLPKIAGTGLILLGFSVFFASLAPGFPLFLVAMACIGFCAALIPISMFPFVSGISPQDRLGMNVGCIVASGILGMIFGRVSMGVLTSAVGWQMSFKLVSGILFFLSAATFLFMGKDYEKSPNSNTPLTGLYANSFRLIFTPGILFLLLAGFALFFGFLGMITILTYRLVAAPFFLTSGEVGWISFAGITAIIAPFAGNLSRKTGREKILLSGLVLCLASIQVMGWTQSVPGIVLGMLLLFLGVYSCQPLLFLLIMEQVPHAKLGSASALYILFCIGGGSLSTMILGPVWHLLGWHGIVIFCSGAIALAFCILALHSYKTSANQETSDAP